MRKFVKDPDSTLDYGFDWTRWLDSDDSISSSTWSAESGITIVPSSAILADNLTSVELTGGTLNRTYVITNTVTTSNGLTDERSFKITIKQR